MRRRFGAGIRGRLQEVVLPPQPVGHRCSKYVYPRLWLSSFNRRWHGGEVGIADALLGAAREIFADHEDPSRVWITDSLFPERSLAQMADAPHHGWYLLRGPHTRNENGVLQGTYIRFATERPKGFRGVLPRRWVAERTFSWFGRSRQPSPPRTLQRSSRCMRWFSVSDT